MARMKATYAILLPDGPRTWWEVTHAQAALRFQRCCLEEPGARVFLVDVTQGLVVGHQVPAKEGRA